MTVQKDLKSLASIHNLDSQPRFTFTTWIFSISVQLPNHYTFLDIQTHFILCWLFVKITPYLKTYTYTLIKIKMNHPKPAKYSGALDIYSIDSYLNP